MSELSLQYSGSTSTVPTVRAIISTQHEFAFVKALGIDARPVSGRAAAIKTVIRGGSGIVPWTIKEETQNAAVLGEIVVMKYDANNADTGNFGAIRHRRLGRQTCTETRPSLAPTPSPAP